ncbi:hypothetical protein AOLI_G00290950 [Acnodon oligacanthus]
MKVNWSETEMKVCFEGSADLSLISLTASLGTTEGKLVQRCFVSAVRVDKLDLFSQAELAGALISSPHSSFLLLSAAESPAAEPAVRFPRGRTSFLHLRHLCGLIFHWTPCLLPGLAALSPTTPLFSSPASFISLHTRSTAALQLDLLTNSQHRTHVGSVEGLAYHRGWDTLYWTSSTTATITRHGVDQSRRDAFNLDTVVRMAGDDHPHVLALDECQNLMFWTNWNEKRPSILRSTLTGRNIRLVVSERILTPNGLTIDHRAEKLYFSDGSLGSLERCDYDGAHRYVVLKAGPGTFFGLAVYGEFLFWSDWERRAVMRSDKLTGADVTVLRADSPQQPMGLAAVANDTHSSLNHTCSEDSFRCRNQLCVPQSFVCDHDDDCGDGSDESPECESLCNGSVFMCANGRCVPLGSVCDRRDDCGDKSDEWNCGVNECLNRRVSGCSQDCQDMPVGYKCTCWPGFRLKADGRTCVDVDECVESFPCSQQCINTYGSFKCLCVDGYQRVDADPHSCRAITAEEPFLILADHHEIRKIGLDGSNYTLLKQGLSSVLSLDFDYRKELIFWIDTSRPSGRRINRMRLNGSDLKVVHRTSVPSALAVDWIGKNLYWCDAERKTVEVAKANGLYPTVLLSLFFWIDCCEYPHIGRMGMDGSKPRVIIDTQIHAPSALTIDYINQRIYWADEKHVLFSDMDGWRRYRVPNEDLGGVTSLALFEDFLYWSDQKTKTLSRAHKTSGAKRSELLSSWQTIRDIKVYHPPPAA